MEVIYVPSADRSYGCLGAHNVLERAEPASINARDVGEKGGRQLVRILDHTSRIFLDLDECCPGGLPFSDSSPVDLAPRNRERRYSAVQMARLLEFAATLWRLVSIMEIIVFNI
jgi:hypothetical protein